MFTFCKWIAIIIKNNIVCMDCFFQAKVHLPLSDARWTLNLAKNKLGQRLRRARRREVGNLGWDGGWVDGFLMFSAFCRMKSSV